MNPVRELLEAGFREESWRPKLSRQGIGQLDQWTEIWQSAPSNRDLAELKY